VACLFNFYSGKPQNTANHNSIFNLSVTAPGERLANREFRGCIQKHGYTVTNATSAAASQNGPAATDVVHAAQRNGSVLLLGGDPRNKQ